MLKRSKSAAVRMFGSRVTDSARGGDIDLHIEADLDQQALLQSAKLQARLWQALDEMPVDVVVHQRTTALRWIDRIAMMGGIIL
jgi:uncharacterized protein